MAIDRLALVAGGAEVSDSAEIGPWVSIEAGARIGARTRLLGHVYVSGATEIAEDCTIMPFTSLGYPPEHIRDEGTGGTLQIGAATTIREHVTIHRGTTKQKTRLGARCYVMAKSHIAHDCQIGEDVILGGYTALSGHTEIGERSVLLGGCGTVPFVSIGHDVYLLPGTGLRYDVLPMMIASNKCLRGINLKGLRMRNKSSEVLQQLRRFYLALKGVENLAERVASLRSEFASSPEALAICDAIEAERHLPLLLPYPAVKIENY